jgi:hypothetical protein
MLNTQVAPTEEGFTVRVSGPDGPLALATVAGAAVQGDGALHVPAGTAAVVLAAEIPPTGADVAAWLQERHRVFLLIHDGQGSVSCSPARPPFSVATQNRELAELLGSIEHAESRSRLEETSVSSRDLAAYVAEHGRPPRVLKGKGGQLFIDVSGTIGPAELVGRIHGEMLEGGSDRALQLISFSTGTSRAPHVFAPVGVVLRIASEQGGDRFVKVTGSGSVMPAGRAEIDALTASDVRKISPVWVDVGHGVPSPEQVALLASSGSHHEAAGAPENAGGALVKERQSPVDIAGLARLGFDRLQARSPEEEARIDARIRDSGGASLSDTDRIAVNTAILELIREYIESYRSCRDGSYESLQYQWSKSEERLRNQIRRLSAGSAAEKAAPDRGAGGNEEPVAQDHSASDVPYSAGDAEEAPSDDYWPDYVPDDMDMSFSDDDFAALEADLASARDAADHEPTPAGRSPSRKGRVTAEARLLGGVNDGRVNLGNWQNRGRAGVLFAQAVLRAAADSDRQLEDLGHGLALLGVRLSSSGGLPMTGAMKQAVANALSGELAINAESVRKLRIGEKTFYARIAGEDAVRLMSAFGTEEHDGGRIAAALTLLGSPARDADPPGTEPEPVISQRAGGTIPRR